MAMSGPGWTLSPEIAETTQGVVVSGYGTLTHGSALFLVFSDDLRRGWIDALEEILQITPASRAHDKELTEAAAIAFTCSGLERLGMEPETLATFQPAFREGMFQTDRLRRLGDKRKGEWLETVTTGGPYWSGNVRKQGPLRRREGYDAPLGPVDAEPVDQNATEITVHAVLFLYARDETVVDAREAQAREILAAHGLEIARRRDLLLDVEGAGFSREHFGFADGMAQPHPYDDEEGAVMRGGETVNEPDPVNGVPLGEFLIGYRNGHHERAPGPVVPGPEVRPGDDRAKDAGLSPHDAARGFYDFGVNGSYMVIRELHQDVAAFWRSMEEAAASVRKNDQEAEHVTGDWLAERVIGRTKDGHILRPEGQPTEAPGTPPSRDFLYYETDPHGYGCPLGSHIRRANPRDSLTPKPFMRKSLLKAANNHRILRRGRKYGPKLEDRTEADGKDRGLLFVCLNTDIARQFEFVQQTWLFNPDFHGIFEEVDPLIGPDGYMTIQEDPLRRRVKVETFVHFAGGEYFFLPSLPALRYLALL